MLGRVQVQDSLIKGDGPLRLVSPLDWSYRMTAAGKEIIATVRKNAAPGLYPYGVGVFDGEELLFDDPDIIVRPPR